MPNKHKKYIFSFTGASMNIHDFTRLAKYVEENEMDTNKQIPDPDIIMRRPNSRTNKREFSELIKRYKQLTDKQRSLLTQVDITGQKQLALLGVVKAYSFIKDFIIEVVREKFFMLDFKLSNGDYQSFFNRKIIAHPELEAFSDSTAKKARQVVFKILEQGGLIDSTKNRNILPQIVGQDVINVIMKDNPELLKVFLMTDAEIKEFSIHE